MNSRRGEPRALFITFYLINRKKAVDPEHHSSKGVHFGFHVSKVHLYICRVIFISLLLYSDLYCKKMTHLFTAQTVVIVMTEVKSKREKKRKGLKIQRSCKIRSRESYVVPKDVTAKQRRVSRNYNVKIFYFYKTDVSIAVNTSKVI